MSTTQYLCFHNNVMEDEMVGWHHQLNGHGCGWTPGVGDGQGGLACCGSRGCKEPDTTEQLNWTLSFQYYVTMASKHLGSIELCSTAKTSFLKDLIPSFGSHLVPMARQPSSHVKWLSSQYSPHKLETWLNDIRP